LGGVELEVALDKAGEFRRFRQAETFLMVADPAVKLGADEVEVFGLRVAFAFANLLGVLAAEPSLDGIGIFFLTPILALSDAFFPDFAGGSP
jgi:hypothetical protein